MLTYDMMGQNFCLGLFLTTYCLDTAIGFLQTSRVNPSDLDLRSSQEYEPEHYKFYLPYRSIIWLIQQKSFWIKQANEMQTSAVTPHWYPYSVTCIGNRKHFDSHRVLPSEKQHLIQAKAIDQNQTDRKKLSQI